MTNHEHGNTPERVETVAQEGLELARAGDYSERFQDILHMTRDGSYGMIPQPEGLALKALYHQARDSSRADGAITAIKEMYSGELFANIQPQVTPLVIESLALLLHRSTTRDEQIRIADALGAAASKLHESGYTPGQ